jgi:hypothetical protein
VSDVPFEDHIDDCVFDGEDEDDAFATGEYCGRWSDGRQPAMRAALVEAEKALAESLNRDFGLWSSPTNARLREVVYPVWKSIRSAIASNPAPKET